MAAERCVLGVDVGGTFTDLTLIRLSDGQVFYHKTPSTPDDPSRAVGDGIEELLARTGVAAADIGYFGHGTTVAINALITGQAAATGLITTEGFRDVLEIRRQRQPHNYDIRMPKPPPGR
jgi:N-methylhydantoinase A